MHAGSGCAVAGKDIRKQSLNQATPSATSIMSSHVRNYWTGMSFASRCHYDAQIQFRGILQEHLLPSRDGGSRTQTSKSTSNEQGSPKETRKDRALAFSLLRFGFLLTSTERDSFRQRQNAGLQRMPTNLEQGLLLMKRPKASKVQRPFLPQPRNHGIVEPIY